MSSKPTINWTEHRDGHVLVALEDYAVIYRDGRPEATDAAQEPHYEVVGPAPAMVLGRSTDALTSVRRVFIEQHMLDFFRETPEALALSPGDFTSSFEGPAH